MTGGPAFPEAGSSIHAQDRVDAAAAGPGRIERFWAEQASLPGPEAARFHREHDAYDLPAIRRFCAEGTRVLDLGCGTCVVANALVTGTGCRVHAVDFVPTFLHHAVDDPRLTTEVADIRNFESGGPYDLVILLGVITSLEERDVRASLYRRCADILAPGGVLFVKAQFGIADEVLVDGWSDQLGAHYRARYPHLPAEVEMLERRFVVEVEDPYPAELNPHPNTHFHYLVARPR